MLSAKDSKSDIQNAIAVDYDTLGEPWEDPCTANCGPNCATPSCCRPSTGPSSFAEELYDNHFGFALMVLLRRFYSLSPIAIGLWNTISTINRNAELLVMQEPSSSFKYGQGILLGSYDTSATSTWSTSSYLSSAALTCPTGGPTYMKMGCGYSTYTVYWGFLIAWMIYWGVLGIYHLVYSIKLSPFDLRFYLCVQMACAAPANQYYIALGILFTFLTACFGWYFCAYNYQYGLPGQDSVAQSILGFFLLNVGALMPFSAALFQTVPTSRTVWKYSKKDKNGVNYEAGYTFNQSDVPEGTKAEELTVGLVAYHALFHSEDMDHALRRIDIRSIPAHKAMSNGWGCALTVNDVFKEIMERLMRMEMYAEYMQDHMSSEDKEIMAGGMEKPVDLFAYAQKKTTIYENGVKKQETEYRTIYTACKTLLEILYTAELSREIIHKLFERQKESIAKRRALIKERDEKKQVIVNNIKKMGDERKNAEALGPLDKTARQEFDERSRKFRQELEKLYPPISATDISNLLRGGGIFLADNIGKSFFEQIMESVYPVGDMFKTCNGPSETAATQWPRFDNFNFFCLGSAEQAEEEPEPDSGCCSSLSCFPSNLCDFDFDIIGVDGLNLMGKKDTKEHVIEVPVDLFQLFIDLLKLIFCVDRIRECVSPAEKV